MRALTSFLKSHSWVKCRKLTCFNSYLLYNRVLSLLYALIDSAWTVTRCRSGASPTGEKPRCWVLSFFLFPPVLVSPHHASPLIRAPHLTVANPAFLSLFFREWRDHVQAGVCPTSRRGHTATLVLDRRVVEPALPEPRHGVDLSAPSHRSAGGNTSNGIDNHGQLGGEGAGGEGNSCSPRQGRTNVGGCHNTSPCEKTPDQSLEGRSSRRGVAGGGHDGGHHGGGGGGGRRRRVEGGFKIGADREAKDCISREMFVIGGAGTDPIKVRAGMGSR